MKMVFWCRMDIRNVHLFQSELAKEKKIKALKCQNHGQRIRKIGFFFFFQAGMLSIPPAGWGDLDGFSSQPEWLTGSSSSLWASVSPPTLPVSLSLYIPVSQSGLDMSMQHHHNVVPGSSKASPPHKQRAGTLSVIPTVKLLQPRVVSCALRKRSF